MSVQKPTFYLEQLNKLLLATQVTAAGKNLTLDEGLEKAVQMKIQTHQRGKKIIFIGNGGSAAIASHQAVDYWKNGGMRAVAFNDSSLLTCISNDYGYQYVFEKPIKMFADPNDLLIAISSSGKSENILNGVQAAKAKNCQVITFSGFHPENPLRQTGDLNFYLPAATGQYGFVEISHLVLCHLIVDQIVQKNLIPYKAHES